MRRKLTRLQRKLARQIRGLFARGEPLNICAVKRNHPELMKAVYEIKPFWGWRQALEAAGIDYSKIKVQLEPYEKCRICGEHRVLLGPHIRSAHGVDKDDYRMDYPGAFLGSEDWRARISKMKGHPVRHWEPVWTSEYVLDRVAEYRRRKLRVNAEWLFRHDIAFYAQATLYFGNWSKALAAAGLDPAEIYHEFRWRYPSKNTVVEAIRQRHRKGWPLDTPTLARGEMRYRDSALFVSGRALFGSWPAALTAAGIDPLRLLHMKHRAHRRYPDRQAVIREFRRRHRSGLAIHRAAVDRSRPADKALARSAIEYFGSWNAALKAAGFAPAAIAAEKFRRLRRYADAKAVIREIKRRRRAGSPLAGNGLYKGPRGDEALINTAKALFSSWPDALRAAGIDPVEIHRELMWRYPSKEEVVAAITQRHRKGWPVNYATLNFGGRRYRDTALLAAGKACFGSWPAALAAAGIDARRLRQMARRANRRYPDKQAVVRELRRRRAAGWAINLGELSSGEHPDQALKASGREYFGSWDASLKAAGIDPDTVLRRRRRRAAK